MTIVRMTKHDLEICEGYNSWVIIDKFVYESNNGELDPMAEPHDLSGVFVGDVSEMEIAQFLEHCGVPWVANFE